MRNIAPIDSGPAAPEPPLPPDPAAPVASGGSAADATTEIARLRSELAAKTEALEEAAQAVEAAQESRDRFIANVSHELRTPLSAILLWSSLIDEQQVTNPELAEALGAIRRSAEEQSALIDDIVDTSRLLAGRLRLEPEPLDLAGVMRATLDRLAPAAATAAVTLAIEVEPGLPEFRGDTRRLGQMLAYLVHNALKFTPAGGRILVDLRPAGGSEVAISVRDTGAGIAPDVLPGLLDRTPQIGGKCARSEIGLGLGLPLARRIAQLHGGSLSAQSSGPGCGSTFTVHLPLNAGSAPAMTGTDSTAASVQSLAGCRVLLVDSRPESTRTLSAMLEEAGARVQSAGADAAARVASAAEAPDLLVVAIDGSGAGLTLVAGLRQREEARHARTVPALGLIPSADSPLLDRALEAGFQTCLPEPVDARQLCGTIAALQASSRRG